jgi:hypothetical protein
VTSQPARAGCLTTLDSWAWSRTACSTFYEFRVGTGRILGLRLEGGTRITPDVRLLADVALYDHHLTDGAAGPDWSQRRLSVRLDWTVGRDPGTAGLPGIPP